jgi:hypothetical protein
MSTGSQKPNKVRRIFGRFKRKSTSTRPEQSEMAISVLYDDKERTRVRYLKAVSLLDDALKGRNEKWGNFKIPELEGELENINPEEFRRKLEALCQSYSAKRNEDWVQKCAHVLKCCFTAFAPFAKNFLAIVREGTQVCCSRFFSLTSRSQS